MREGDDILLVGIYVDDMMVLYKSDASGGLYDRFSRALHRDWEAEDEDEIADLLNIHFRQSGESLTDGMRVTSKAVPPYWYTCHMFLRRLRIFVPTMYLPLCDILPPYG